MPFTGSDPSPPLGLAGLSFCADSGAPKPAIARATRDRGQLPADTPRDGAAQRESPRNLAAAASAVMSRCGPASIS